MHSLVAYTFGAVIQLDAYSIRVPPAHLHWIDADWVSLNGFFFFFFFSSSHLRSLQIAQAVLVVVLVGVGVVSRVGTMPLGPSRWGRLWIYGIQSPTDCSFYRRRNFPPAGRGRASPRQAPGRQRSGKGPFCAEKRFLFSPSFLFFFFSCLPASNTLPTEESMDVLWQSINLFDLPSVILYSMYRKEEYKFWHLLFLFTSKYKSSLLFFINLGSIPLGVAAVFFFLWWILPYGKMPVAALQHMIRDSEEKTQNPLR